MPLIIICGLPSSGKTYRTNQLKEYFTALGKTVKIVSENEQIPRAGYLKNDYFADSLKEKIIRANLKSETIRLLNKDDVIILDSGNYIKGYRYELYCASKAARTTQCTLYCAIVKDNAWEFNQKRQTAQEILPSEEAEEFNNSNIAYTEDIFNQVCQRFEEPQSNNRWDSPLFISFPEAELEFENINMTLFEKKPPPPNLSTQNKPLSSTNYLFELDKITQEITSKIIDARKLGNEGEITISNVNDLKVNLPSNINAMQLNRLRRQFLNYSKHGASNNLKNVPTLFIQFLNSNC